MVSIIGIIGIFPLIIVFGICFALTLRSYLNNPDHTKIFFMIWSISVALTYISWGLRVLLVPQYETDKTILYPFWAFAYAFGGLALISLDFATLNLTKKQESTILKFIRIIILVGYIGVLIILIIGFEMELIVFMDVSDLTIINPFVYFYFTLLILFYIFFPNAIFINYLRKSPEKNTFTYKRVRTIEVGILLFCIGMALDGARIPSNIGILIARLIELIGGIITMKGYLMKPTSGKENN